MFKPSVLFSFWLYANSTSVGHGWVNVGLYYLTLSAEASISYIFEEIQKEDLIFFNKTSWIPKAQCVVIFFRTCILSYTSGEHSWKEMLAIAILLQLFAFLFIKNKAFYDVVTHKKYSLSLVTEL